MCLEEDYSDQVTKPELTFPCEFPLKVIGRDEDDFFNCVVELVSRHVPGLTTDAFSEKRSSQGRYVSVSVTFIAESRAQVDALYEDLTRQDRVLFAL